MATTYAKLSAKVINKTLNDMAQKQNMPDAAREESPFKQMLENMSDGQQFAQALGMTNQGLTVAGLGVDSISAEGMPIDTANLSVGLEQPNGVDRVVDMLSEVNDGQMQMEHLVNQILYSGKKFSNQELLAIQAHVFHFAQITELVVKAADQGVSSVKAVLNTNIQ